MEQRSPCIPFSLAGRANRRALRSFKTARAGLYNYLYCLVKKDFHGPIPGEVNNRVSL
jgi:hypothetical protein